MKAILKFNLLKAEHDLRFKRALNADAVYFALDEFVTVLRTYEKKELTNKESDLLEKLSKEFYEILEENKVNLDLM